MTAAPTSVFKGHRADVNALFADESIHTHTLASGSDDGTCRLWDTRTAKTSRCLNVTTALGYSSSDKAPTEVNAIAFDRVGKDTVYVATGSQVLSFDLRQEGMILTSTCNEALQANTDEINSLHFHPTKNQSHLLCAADDSGAICIYDTNTNRLTKTLRNQHDNLCMQALFRPKSSWDIASCGLDGFLLFWDFSRGRLRSKIDFNAGGAVALDSIETATPTSANANQMVNPPLVHSIAFHSAGKTLAAGLGDFSVAVVDFTTKNVVRKLEEHTGVVNQVHFPAFKKDEWLISCGNDRKVCVWDYANASRNDQSADEKFLLKQFHVQAKSNAVTSTASDNMLYVADTTNQVKAYALV